MKTTQTAPQWTHTDTRAAMREGWLLASVDNRPDLVEIERLDSAERFASDAEAFAHVKAWSRSGSALHAKAFDALRGVCRECGKRAESFNLGGVSFSTLAPSLQVCAECVNAS